MSQKSKKKKSDLGSALAAAGITADRYKIPYDAKKIATEAAACLADGLRGKVLFNHTREFKSVEEAREYGWDDLGVSFHICEEADIKAGMVELLAYVKKHVGNRFVAFAHILPSESVAADKVRHVVARCKLTRDGSQVWCELSVVVCTNGARDE